MADSAAVRVLIVEDDMPTRMRLEGIVGARGELELVGGVGTLAQGLEALRRCAPDVLLVDLGLPDGSGLELIRAIARQDLRTEAMVITVFDDEAHVVAAIEAGATGYLLKDGAAQDVGDCIIQLMRGGSPISSSIARHILRQVRTSPQPVAAADATVSLTPREAEVLKLVAKGMGYGEIAPLLGMSVHTVTSHVKHIYRKLSVRSRGEAVFEAVQRGLIRIEHRG